MSENFKVIRTDAEDGSQRVIPLTEAVLKLQSYYKDKRLVRESLADGQTLRTPFAFYKRAFEGD